jgi:hypothetical protein
MYQNIYDYGSQILEALPFLEETQGVIALRVKHLRNERVEV